MVTTFPVKRSRGVPALDLFDKSVFGGRQDRRVLLSAVSFLGVFQGAVVLVEGLWTVHLSVETLWEDAVVFGQVIL